MGQGISNCIPSEESWLILRYPYVHQKGINKAVIATALAFSGLTEREKKQHATSTKNYLCVESNEAMFAVQVVKLREASNPAVTDHWMHSR